MKQSIPKVSKLLPTESIDGILEKVLQSKEWEKAQNDFNQSKTIYIIGNGGYAKAVKWGAKQNNFNVENIIRDNWDELFDIKNSVVYNCTPIDITDWIDKSNDFINCLVTTQTGFDLASMQASKQFELYTGLEFPL